MTKKHDNKNTPSAVILKSVGWFALAVAFFVAVWVVAYFVVGNEYVLPSPWQTAVAGFWLLGTAELWTALLSTFLRALEALAIAFAFAVAFAVLAHVLPQWGRFLAFFVSALRSLPTMAVLLMLLIWTTPSFAPVVVAFMALFPILYTSMRAALAAVDKDLVQMCEVYRVPMKKRILDMYLPIASPYVVRELAGAAAFALKLIVSAEIMAYTYRSLGGMLQDAQIFSEMPRLFALTVLVIVLGLLLEGAGIFFARLLEKKTR